MIGPLGVTSYFVAKRLSCFSQQREHIIAIDGGFARIHANVNVAGADCTERVDAIEQCDQVVCDNVVLVLVGNFASQLPSDRSRHQGAANLVRAES